MAKKQVDDNLLLKSALNEFSSYSYDEASLNRIISNSGISKGSFYYRFSNKYEIYKYLIIESNRQKWDFINSEALVINNENADIFTLFLIQAEIGVKFANAHPELYRLSQMFYREKGSDIYNKILEELRIKDESSLSVLIKSAFDSGNFKNNYTFEFIDKLISSLLYSFNDIFFNDDEYTLEKSISFIRGFVYFMKHGLYRED